MRVLWLSHLVPFPPKGGMLQRSYHLLRELSRHHEVMALCFNQRALLPNDAAVLEARDAISQFATVFDIQEIPSNIKVLGRTRLALGSYFRRSPYTIQWLRSSRYRKSVALAKRTFAPDIVHFDTISLAQYRNEFGDEPCVLNHHNIESSMMDRRAQNEPNALKRHYFAVEADRLRAYESQVANAFALHLTCSDLDADRLAAICPGAAIKVVPNGVDLSYFEPSYDRTLEQNQSLIFVGGLNWYPNVSAVRFLVEKVWPLVSSEFPAATLSIIGRNPPGWLTTLSKANPRIRVPGFVDDVRPYMDRAAVYVCPIFDGGGTKLKVLDAMAMAKPLVANPIALEGIDAEPGKHWISASSPSDFLSALRQLFLSQELRTTIGTNARELVQERYSFSMIGKKLSAQYEALASAPPSTHSAFVTEHRST